MEWVRAGKSGVLFEKRGEPVAEVAERVAAGGGGFQIGLDELPEAALGQEQPQRGKILGDGIKQAIPVLAVVKLEPFDGAQLRGGSDPLFCGAAEPGGGFSGA